MIGSARRPRGVLPVVLVALVALVAAGAAVLLLVRGGDGQGGGAVVPDDAAGSRVVRTAFVTGYSVFDNTPPGSVAISHPSVHRTAGGVGTYEDPTTIAVGHSLETGEDVLDYPTGTRMYLPHLRRYGVVEDTCGDGPNPQDGPCHDLGGAPQGATTWLDIWIGGDGTSAEEATACARQVTGLVVVVVEPRPDLAVDPGPILGADGCARTHPVELVTR